MIVLDRATKTFSKDGVFTFDLTVERGTSLGVIGPSGAGKSTLLHMVAGFVALDAGHVGLDGVNYTHSAPAQRPISMVFQANNLFDHLDVAVNVGLGINPRFKRSHQAMDQVRDALAQVGLLGFEDRRPTSLSGGEAQRVALARALVRDTPILLLDEPFAALGPSMRQGFSSLLSAMQKERALTMLVVSHAPTELIGLCDQLAFVLDGKIAAHGEAGSMLETPPHPALAAYLGHPFERLSDTNDMALSLSTR